MKRQRTPRSARPRRRGAVLVMVAILLPVLMGVVGLVIDAGLLMTASRQTQNAADAGATAAASDLLRGRSLDAAKTTAQTFVRDYNGLEEATVTVNVPPSKGPYQDDPNHVEVLLSNPVQTWLIHVVGVNRDQHVLGRAVAGYRPATPAAGVIVLDRAARPGLSVGGRGKLLVNGGVVVNSEGGGLDENGQPINNGNTGYAATVSNNAEFHGIDVQVVGGVNNPSNFKNYDPNNPNSPLRTGALVQPDPLLYLPPPTTGNGADPTEYPAVAVTGNETVTLSPGVYPSISITSGKVTFEPGIYIIRGGDLKVTEQDVTAEGVMFYITGSDYNVNTGWPDAGDMDNPPPASGSATFGGATINAGLTFSGYDNPNSPFHGMLFYQRRLNTKEFSVQGNSSSGNLAGTIYAKWAPVKISGQGTYAAQFVVGKLDVSGSGSVTIEYADQNLGRANRVFLVE